MFTVEIPMSDSLKEFVECQVAKGGFRDASEYVQSLLEARLAEEQAELRPLIVERVNDGGDTKHERLP